MSSEHENYPPNSPQEGTKPRLSQAGPQSPRHRRQELRGIAKLVVSVVSVVSPCIDCAFPEHRHKTLTTAVDVLFITFGFL